MYTDSHKLLMRYLIERLVPGTIIVPIDVVNLVVARLMFWKPNNSNVKTLKKVKYETPEILVFYKKNEILVLNPFQN